METPHEPIKPINKEFEAINTLPDQTKFKILYVKAGFAKVGQIGLEKTNYDNGESKTTTSELLSLGLVSKTVIGLDNHIFINYSSNQKDLDDYEKDLTAARKDTKEIHLVNGKYFGTPQTAVDAYTGSTQISYFDFPQDILDNPISKLIHYSMSKVNFAEEWKNYVQNANRVAQKYPELIQKLNLGEYFKK